MIYMFERSFAYRNRCGFTLVELSIVLVILGLLVGGVLSGQALIEAARVRALSTEVENFKTAINTFYERYDQLPGDMTNASTLWPACIDYNFGINPCNGNGSGHIGGGPLGPYAFGEPFRAWQHMTLAGVIEGNYGSSDASGGGYSSFINMPATNLPAAGMPVSKYNNSANFLLEYTGDRTSCMAAFSPNVAYCDHDFIYAVRTITNGSGLKDISSAIDGSLMTPTEAYLFDRKYDDGMPYTGAILGIVLNTTYNGISGTNYNISTSNAKDVHSINLMFVR